MPQAASRFILPTPSSGPVDLSPTMVLGLIPSGLLVGAALSSQGTADSEWDVTILSSISPAPPVSIGTVHIVVTQAAELAETLPFTLTPGHTVSVSCVQTAGPTATLRGRLYTYYDQLLASGVIVETDLDMGLPGPIGPAGPVGPAGPPGPAGSAAPVKLIVVSAPIAGGTIPLDNSIPTGAEGAELVSGVFTLSNASNQVRIRANVCASITAGGTGQYFVAFVSVDGGPAVRTVAQYGDTASGAYQLSIDTFHAPGDVLPHTYSVRGGATFGTGNWTTNVASPAADFGGTMATILTLEEAALL